jgi:hypothetical protein
LVNYFLYNQFEKILFFRDSVRVAFQPVRRKSQIIRLNSNDCSNEIEDVMTPWLLDEPVEDMSFLRIQ